MEQNNNIKQYKDQIIDLKSKITKVNKDIKSFGARKRNKNYSPEVVTKIEDFITKLKGFREEYNKNLTDLKTNKPKTIKKTTVELSNIENLMDSCEKEYTN